MLTCMSMNGLNFYHSSWLVGWLVLGLTALRDSISVYIGPSPKEREKEERRIDESKNVQNNPLPDRLIAQ